MKGGKTPLGYTIIEVLIVLAASSMMFVIAANFINGKQARTAFTSGVNELASQLQDTIEEVTNGQYSDVPITCTANAGGITISDVSGEQGKNSSCLFLGKMLHFSVNGDKTVYESIPVAGRRIVALTGKPVANLAQSTPVSVAPLTVSKNMPQSLQVSNMRINSISPRYSVGFLQNFGPDTGGGPSVRGAALPAKMYFINGVNSTTNSVDAQSNVSTGLTEANLAEICVTDGTRNAVITIDQNSSQRLVAVKMKGTNPCFP